MKILRHFIPVLLVSLHSLSAQENVPKWDVEIPEAISDETPSPPAAKPAPLDLKVLNSRTTRIEVTEAPEMHDLPPVTGTINVTVQLVEDPQLPEPPPPLPVLPPSDPAVVARLAEITETHPGTDLVFLSATVYNQKRTLLTIYPNETNDDKVTAWSNLDFNHFSGFASYRVKDSLDENLHDFGILMGIGNEETDGAKDSESKALEIPKMPNFTDTGPAFVVVEGDAKSPAIDTLEQLHDLYRKEGKKLEQAYHAREKAYADRKAYLLANPPVPNDVVNWITKPRRTSPAAADTTSKP